MTVKDIMIDTIRPIDANSDINKIFQRILWSTVKMAPYVNSNGEPIGILTKPMVSRAAKAGSSTGIVSDIISKQIEGTDFIIVPLSSACPNVTSQSTFHHVYTAIKDEYVAYNIPILFIKDDGEFAGISIIHKED